MSPEPALSPALQLLLWHSALWTVQEATPLGPASSLPQSFLLKCLEQVRKIQGDGAALQEKLVSEAGERAVEGSPVGRAKGDGTVGRHPQEGMWENIRSGGAGEGWEGTWGGGPWWGQCSGGLAGMGVEASHSGEGARAAVRSEGGGAGQRGTEQPGKTWREGKDQRIREDQGRRSGDLATASLTLHPSIPSVPPTSCATLRSWCCLDTLWASPGLP